MRAALEFAVPQLSLHSPLGPLTVSEEETGLVALDWGWACAQQETALLRRARTQLDAYFDGVLDQFELPLAPTGSQFCRTVWAALQRIPFGATRTYAELADEVGGCARAVGQANRYNPLPILIPCHRVVSRRGVGGFTGLGGTDTKRFLLDHERDD